MSQSCQKEKVQPLRFTSGEHFRSSDSPLFAVFKPFAFAPDLTVQYKQSLFPFFVSPPEVKFSPRMNLVRRQKGVLPHRRPIYSGRPSESGESRKETLIDQSEEKKIRNFVESGVFFDSSSVRTIYTCQGMMQLFATNDLSKEKLGKGFWFSGWAVGKLIVLPSWHVTLPLSFDFNI